MNRQIRAIAAWLLVAAPALSAAPVPTVVVDIHARGAAGVAALKAGEGVRWSAELGDELLLGVDASSLDAWLARDGVRRGPGELAFEEIVVRDHACAHDEHDAPALAHVGGYEILRMTPVDALATRGAMVAGEPLPAHGVVSREVRNDARAVAPDGADPFVASVVARVDAQRWFDTMSALAAFNRNSFSPSLPTARDWLLARFGEAGLATETFTFDLNATSCSPVPPIATLQNPIGVHAGATLPDEWIVVGAHYDSRNASRCDGTVNPQPGANDNGTGCGGVVELARAFQGVETARTIVFMCFAGEEQGLVGSRRYVESL
ncbi:MAG TPA: M28 family peptidase, partial [Xanthomonadales bacterium]|nr:M28 family peptidase [Xanthomonadales bacterium]